MFTLIGTTLGAMLDTVVGLILVACIFFIFVIFLVGEIRLFKKCGQEGWKAIIPFYSSYIFTVKICRLHWAWFVATLLIDLSIISTNGASAILRLFVKAMSFYNLGLKGHRDPVPALIFGALFPEIVTCVYGFGSYTYDEFVDVKESGVF